MIETLSVTTSGTALSFLLYENMKSQYTQEGFLIGEIVEREKKTITDNDQAQVHMERTIHITTAVPCPQPHYFYDGVGRLDIDKLKAFLGDFTNKIVGWYKYRRGISNICLTFRERIIHKQLSNFLKIPLDLFTCGLLMSYTSDNKSTHSFNQTFVRLVNDGLEEIPFRVINLSDSNNSYKTPEQVSNTFVKIMSGLDIDHEKTQGVNVITQIQNTLQKHTDSLVEELARAEKRLFELENEIRELNSEEYSGTNNNNEIMEDSNSGMDDSAKDAVAEEEEAAKIEADDSPASRTRQKSMSPTKRRCNQSPVKKGKNNSGREIFSRSQKKK